MAMTTRSFSSTRSPRWYAFCGLAAGAALALAGTGVRASIVTYAGNDPAAGPTDPRPDSTTAAANFDPNAGTLGPVTYQSFETLPVGSFSSLNIGGGATLTGTNSGGTDQEISDATYGTYTSVYGYNTTFMGSNYVYLRGGTATFTFSTPIDAFGAFFTGVQYDGETISFNDGTPETLTLQNPGTSGGVEFYGFTDGGKLISSITINTLNSAANVEDFIGVDDVRFSTVPVPEPSSLALLAGAGIAGGGAWRRARRGRTA